MGVRRRILAGVLLALAACGLLPLSTSAETRTLSYARDGAGRLCRVGDGTGMFREYRHDGAGNVLGSRLRRLWTLSVKKPAKAAWVLSVAGDGTVEGFGVDDAGTVLSLSGTLAVEGGAVTGTLALYDTGDETALGSLDLAGSRATSDGAGPLALTLKGSGSAGTLSAKGTRPAGAFEGFSGVFGGAKNLLQVGSARTHPGVVAFWSEGTRGGVSRVDGEGIEGFLLRDAAGKAYGVVETGSGPVPVLAKMKDGAKSVSLKSAKGSAAKLKMKVKP